MKVPNRRTTDADARRAARLNAILEYKGTVAPRYDSENMAEVLFRLNASVWTAVLPWCFCNTAFAAAIFFSDSKFDIASTDRGHAFMSLSVSYLLVTRAKICLDRYMKQRAGLSNLMQTCRELVSHAVVFTRFKNGGQDGTKWRCSVAKRTICLLKVIVSVLKYPTTKRNVWEIHDLPKEVREALLLAVGKSNERTPLVLTLFLRTVIVSHGRKLKQKLEVPQEMALLQYTTKILDAYTDIMTYMSTPYPFPLVQMTRTILIFYIFSLPVALANDITSPVPYLLLIFIITYGFIGIELVCVEIDDPFGDDPNDFDVDAIAKTVYKDIIVFIADSDGKEAETEVRDSIINKLNDEVKNVVVNHDADYCIREKNWGEIEEKRERYPDIQKWRDIAKSRHTLVETSAIFQKVQTEAIEKDKLHELEMRNDNNKGNDGDRKRIYFEADSYNSRPTDSNTKRNTEMDNTFKDLAGGLISPEDSVRFFNINDDDDDLSLDEENGDFDKSPKKGLDLRSPNRQFSHYGVSHSKLIHHALHKRHHVDHTADDEDDISYDDEMQNFDKNISISSGDSVELHRD